MIVIAGQRDWVREAYGKNPIGVYVQTLDAVRCCPVGSYVFFVHWSEKIPTDVLQDYICVGFHMTDLPYGRGGNPLQNLILLGIKDTKLTAYRMTNELDAGNILLKKDFHIEDNVTASEIYYDVSDLALQMVKEIVDKGDFTGTPQEGGGSVEFFRIKDMQVKDTWLPEYLLDFIRAFDAKGYSRPYLDYGNLQIEFEYAYKQKDEIVAGVKICPKR